MLTVFIRGTVLYLVAVLAMRVMGKRQAGEMQPFELVIALMIADLAAAPMESIGTPILYGIAPIAALVFLHGLITILSLRSQKIRSFISGRPSVLMRGGSIETGEMMRIGYTLDDFSESLRAQGYLSIADIDIAILETNGQLSVFPKADKRPVTPEDMKLTVDQEGLPLAFIMDGHVQRQNLKRAKLDMKWLTERLDSMGVPRVEDVFFCSLDTRGELFVQPRDNSKRARRAPALPKDKVCW